MSKQGSCGVLQGTGAVAMSHLSLHKKERAVSVFSAQRGRFTPLLSDPVCDIHGQVSTRSWGEKSVLFGNLRVVGFIGPRPSARTGTV